MKLNIKWGISAKKYIKVFWSYRMNEWALNHRAKPNKRRLMSWKEGEGEDKASGVLWIYKSSYKPVHVKIMAECQMNPQREQSVKRFKEQKIIYVCVYVCVHI